MSLSPSAPTFCITVFYFVVESVKFGGCLLISGTCVRKSNGGELRGESERKLKICHRYVYVCSIFITILSIFANLHTHSCCLCESTNQVHKHIRVRARFGLRHLSLLYVCSAAGGGGSITNIIGE